jgi:hypothetical protein
MAIDRIHSFLVHPGKHEEEQPEISGTPIPKRGSLYMMLTGVFERATEECDIEIVFRPDKDGQQENDCHDLIVSYAQEPAIAHGRQLASRLQEVSTHRSGLGLLFLMKGSEKGVTQLVLSRFPADQGIIVEERAQQLSVEFIERVFMKNAKAYKSALYCSDALERGFWEGRAVDRQISGPRELSDYWIRDFLASELRTTGPAGTKRLANALREATRSAGDLAIREELIAAATLLRGQNGRRRSARQFVENLGLSEPAMNVLAAAFPREDLMDEVFEFDREEFQRHAPYRSVELDNGGLLIAEDANFPQVFRRELVNPEEQRVRYVTEGRVIDERLRKTK